MDTKCLDSESETQLHVKPVANLLFCKKSTVWVKKLWLSYFVSSHLRLFFRFFAEEVVLAVECGVDVFDSSYPLHH